MSSEQGERIQVLPFQKPDAFLYIQGNAQEIQCAMTLLQHNLTLKGELIIKDWIAMKAKILWNQGNKMK